MTFYKFFAASHRVFLATAVVLALFSVSANSNFPMKPNKYFASGSDPIEQAWVNSKFDQLTQDERIGQVLMIRAHSDKGVEYEQQVLDLIKKYRVGGLCFFQGTPEKQAELTNLYQANSTQLPLMISMDAEWGLGMRLKESTMSFPKAIMLGAIRDNGIIYEMGREIGRQCRRLGVHVNFAPVLDINNNPNNPVINDRSFGESRENVTSKAYVYALGMQDEKVLACGKHFPGHGDTDVDSHEDLPVLMHSRNRLDSLEFFPFRTLFNQGLGSVMVAHLNVPSLDKRKNRPTTLSEKTVQGILRDEMHFDGLIFTDAMEMKGVTKFFDPGMADVAALKAGNDVVLLPENVHSTVKAIRAALVSGEINAAQFEASVKRVLRTKYRLGLTKPQTVDLNNLRNDLNNTPAKVLNRRLVEQSLTLVRDKSGLVPFRNLKNLKIASLAVGTERRITFQKTASKYAEVSHHNIMKGADAASWAAIQKKLAGFDVVLVSFHNLSRYAKSQFGLSKTDIDQIKKLAKEKNVLIAHFGNPYALQYFDGLPTVVQAYEETYDAQDLTAQAIFGAVHFSGTLPITASPEAKFGDGIWVENTFPRLRYDLPERVGMRQSTLERMDTLIAQMIGEGAAPGCQVLVARRGTIVYEKTYGYHTYTKNREVLEDDYYDLASLTKVAATTISLMRLVDEGKIDIKAKMSDYIPELKNSNKANLRFDEVLAHHAALRPWIPFYKNTLTPKGRPDPKVYSPAMTAEYSIPVVENLFMNQEYETSLWNELIYSELRGQKSYRYSDLGMYLAMKAIKNASGKSLDSFTEKVFYQPLGAYHTLFNPWKIGQTYQCPPTEEDRYFRNCTVQGYVHDMGAAMLGGVSGHAGLFSNANDLAKIFQMLLNKGNYLGYQYIRPETIQQFTTRFSGSSRRGLGFDMKELNGGASQNVCARASSKTFGHTGFTGTCAWADPEKDLIFIFLSNRTYPSQNNNRLFNNDYRIRLQAIAYDAIVSDIQP